MRTNNITSSKKQTLVSVFFLNWFVKEKKPSMALGVTCARYLVGSWDNEIITITLEFFL
jgi:hypothetical protein